MLRIGGHTLSNRLILAPMAGVTDQPFRKLCKRLGAGLTVCEMVSSNPALRGTKKSRLRIDHCSEDAPISVQIAGGVASQMSEAARYNVDQGAAIIDINMGCPAKKVCNVSAGSALLSDERLVGRILEAVVSAVDVPVTLKIRTGPSPQRRNAVRIARIAESAGISALAVHGRTRACAFKGNAEHDSVREVKRAVAIPVIANGDVTTPEAAREVLESSSADGLMIGRAAQGNPWIFRDIEYYLATGRTLDAPGASEVRDTLVGHLHALHNFYGTHMGVRVARKHLAWYCKARPGGDGFWRRVCSEEQAAAQVRLVAEFFEAELDRHGETHYPPLDRAA